MEGKILFWEALFVISPAPAKNNLFKVSDDVIGVVLVFFLLTLS